MGDIDTRDVNDSIVLNDGEPVDDTVSLGVLDVEVECVGDRECRTEPLSLAVTDPLLELDTDPL